jgi:antirestriction protein
MLRIFYANLGLYNEGIISGEWLELPATDKEIEDAMNRTGYDDTHEEYFIPDYETDVHGLRIGEYDSIDELNKIAELIDDEPEKAEALIYFGYSTAEEIAENLDNVFYIATCEGFMNEHETIGYYYAEECGGLNIPEEIKGYFDYEAYGRDIALNGNFYTTETGDIYELAR